MYRRMYGSSQLLAVESILENMDVCGKVKASSFSSRSASKRDCKIVATGLCCEPRDVWRCGWTDDAMARRVEEQMCSIHSYLVGFLVEMFVHLPTHLVCKIHM